MKLFLIIQWFFCYCVFALIEAWEKQQMLVELDASTQSCLSLYSGAVQQHEFKYIPMCSFFAAQYEGKTLF